MAFTKYENLNIGAKRLAQIEQANEILDEYAEQGNDHVARLHGDSKAREARLGNEKDLDHG